MTNILYTSKNKKNYNFLYSFQQEYLEDHEGNVLIFEIWEEGKEELDKFSFMLREMENGTDLKVVDLFSDSKKYYLGKGISRAMILHCKNLFVNEEIKTGKKLGQKFGNE